MRVGVYVIRDNYGTPGSSPARLTNLLKFKTIKEMTGSSNTNRFKPFQIRWAEKLGYPDNPYLVRWSFFFFGYSIRIHHWIKSDDDRFFHDHSANLVSIVLKGHYWNVKPIDITKNPGDISVNNSGRTVIIDDCGTFFQEPYNTNHHYVEGIFNSFSTFLNMRKSIWYSKAEDLHYLRIPKCGAWTLMFEGRPKQKWGFIVNGHKWRPLRYFHKYGIKQTEDYQ